jgi:hypothetical protein
VLQQCPLFWLCYRHDNQISVVIEPGLHIIFAAFSAQSRPCGSGSHPAECYEHQSKFWSSQSSHSFSRHSWLCLQHRWKLCRTLASADVMTITDLLFGYPIIFWTAATTAIKTNSPNAGRRPISQGFQGLAADHDGTGERLPS